MNWLLNAFLEVVPFNPASPPHQEVVNALGTVENIIWIIINVLLGLLGVAAALFFVWIGFKLAKAEDESKRKEAKKQMLFAIIAVLGVVILIVLWNTVILNAMTNVTTFCRMPNGNLVEGSVTNGVCTPR